LTAHTRDGQPPEALSTFLAPSGGDPTISRDAPIDRQAPAPPQIGTHILLDLALGEMMLVLEHLDATFGDAVGLGAVVAGASLLAFAADILPTRRLTTPQHS